MLEMFEQRPVAERLSLHTHAAVSYVTFRYPCTSASLAAIQSRDGARILALPCML